MSTRRYLSAAALLTLLTLIALPAYGRSPSLKEEGQTVPACVGIKDGAEWAKCMERFKDVRPQHQPTKLMFDDWRNP